MIFGSVCSGIGAPEVAWHPLGFRAAWCAEIAEFPSRVLAERWPEVPNLRDFTKIGMPDGPTAAPVDLLVGGTPCFPGETLVMLRRGLVPISEVIIGDEALTHEGRWRRVLAIGAKVASTIVVKGQGASHGIETTEEHPFYTRKMYRRWDNEERNWSRELHSPEWTSAKDLKGLMWCSPTRVPRHQRIPKITPRGRESHVPRMSPELMQVIGRWLGDGWCRISERRGSVMICGNPREKRKIAKELRAANVHFCCHRERTTIRFVITSRAFARWLVENFGHGAARKSIPTWALGMPPNMRRALFDGYVAADGHQTKNGSKVSTISKSLALSFMLLAHTLGYGASRRLIKMAKTSVIEGRVVNQRDSWLVSVYNRSRSSIADGNGRHRWGLVRKVEPGRDGVIVHNLEVEEDNSYVADGMVVHNCTSFSVAGQRAGLDDPRGHLAIEFLLLARRLGARWVVWENVPGAFSSDSGEDFATFLGLMVECGYGVAWRVLDAQWFGVPQRRRRVFAVGYLGNWRPSVAVLFERPSMHGNPAARRDTWEDVAAGVGGGVEDVGADAGRVINTLTVNGNRADPSAEPYIVDRVSRTLGAHHYRNAPDDAVIVDCLRACAGKSTSSVGPLVVTPIQDASRSRVREQHGIGIGEAGDPMFTGTTRCGDHAIAFHATQDPISSEGFFPCLGANASVGVVADTLRGGGSGRAPDHGLIVFDEQQITHPENRARPRHGDPAPTLSKASRIDAMSMQRRPRRLTPREWERLMGFADDYTLISKATDSARYAALGNSMAVPVMSYVGRRLQMVDNILKEQGRG